MSLEHARGSRGRPTRRQALLTEAELSWATPQRQRIFWTRRNKRRRPAAERLGEVAKSLLGGRELRAALRLSPIRDLWERTVPEALRNHSEVVGLRGGRLMVMVDDPKLRDARLRLLKELERLILQLADVSEIVPEEKQM